MHIYQKYFEKKVANTNIVKVQLRWRGFNFNTYIACVASVSNRVIARKLERKLKKCPSFLDEPREETLATQANTYMHHRILSKGSNA